jgi:hypothetical protein
VQFGRKAFQNRLEFRALEKARSHIVLPKKADVRHRDQLAAANGQAERAAQCRQFSVDRRRLGYFEPMCLKEIGPNFGAVPQWHAR